MDARCFFSKACCQICKYSRERLGDETLRSCQKEPGKLFPVFIVPTQENLQLAGRLRSSFISNTLQNINVTNLDADYERRIQCVAATILGGETTSLGGRMIVLTSAQAESRQ
jgi:hypothetical protein